ARRIGAWIVSFVQAQIEQHRLERAERLAEEEEAARAEAAVAFEAALAPAPEETPKSFRRVRRKKEEATLEADLDGRVAPADSDPAAGEREEAPLAPVVPLVPADPAWAT